MNLSQKITEIETQLLASDTVFGQGSLDAKDEATWIALYALGMPLDCLFNGSEIHWRDVLSSEQLEAIERLLATRLDTRKPFAYLINEAWFGGKKFYVDERVIIPRSYLVEWIPDAFEPWIDSDEINSILDLCTGSGCIAIACAEVFQQATIVASDISLDALAVAKINIDNHALAERVRLHHGNGFEGISSKFDLILCNPPYVSNFRMNDLPVAYRMEPELALRSGNDGLEFIIPMLCQAKEFLTDEGSLVVEAGSAAHALEQKFPDIPFCWLSTEFDEMVVFIMTRKELLRYENRLQSN